MNITKEMIAAVPDRWWLCKCPIPSTSAWDGRWCGDDQIFYCHNKFEVWHIDDYIVHMHEPGIYCDDCLMEARGEIKTSLKEIIANIEKFPDIQLPQSMYSCSGTCLDEEWGVEPEHLFWCTDEFDKPGFYCSECISNSLWGTNDDERYKILDILGERPYYEIEDVIKSYSV